MVPLKRKMADEVSMAYIKVILPKTSCSKFILQDNGMEFKNDQLMSVFDTLSIKCIYSNPYYPQGNGKEKKCNVHHIKPVSSLDVYVGLQVEIPTGAYSQFWDSIQQNSSSDSSANSNPQHSHNLQSKRRK